MKFADPWMLLAFLPLAFAAWRLLRRGSRSAIRFSAVPLLPANAAGWRAKVAAVTPYLMIAALALLTVAAARPRKPLAHDRKSVDAIAIAMTVDVSGSMLALDLTPEGAQPTPETTRLAVVKKLFAEFVEKRPDDLIALVSFGGYASTRSPLTADHQALLKTLEGVEVPTGSNDEQMTAIGDGLATALARLKETPLASKIVILLSDGVSNVGAVEPDAAADAAAKLGIKVYTIGVGTDSVRTPFFARDFFGRQVIQYSNTTFDQKQLKGIAEKTGGTYFSVNDRDGLSAALAEIDKLETTEIEADAYDRWQEQFGWFLLAGALLIFIAVSLNMSASRRMA